MPPRAALDALNRMAPALLGLLEATQVVNDADLRRDIVTVLTSDQAVYPVDAGIHLLRLANNQPARRTRLSVRLDVLSAHCAAILTQRLQQPERRADDWSIPTPGKCRCALCRTLGEFLVARNQVQFDWPLAKDARAHIHRVLDQHALPVTHVTRRVGRPFTLVLRKTDVLFEREAADRRKWREDLSWLRGSPAAPDDPGEDRLVRSR